MKTSFVTSRSTVSCIWQIAIMTGIIARSSANCSASAPAVWLFPDANSRKSFSSFHVAAKHQVHVAEMGIDSLRSTAIHRVSFLSVVRFNIPECNYQKRSFSSFVTAAKSVIHCRENSYRSIHCDSWFAVFRRFAISRMRFAGAFFFIYSSVYFYAISVAFLFG